MHSVHIMGGVLHPKSGISLSFSYPSNSAKGKRDRNCESAEFGCENACAERRDGNTHARINLV